MILYSDLFSFVCFLFFCGMLVIWRLYKKLKLMHVQRITNDRLFFLIYAILLTRGTIDATVARDVYNTC